MVPESPSLTLTSSSTQSGYKYRGWLLIKYPVSIVHRIPPQVVIPLHAMSRKTLLPLVTAVLLFSFVSPAIHEGLENGAATEDGVSGSLLRVLEVSDDSPSAAAAADYTYELKTMNGDRHWMDKRRKRLDELQRDLPPDLVLNRRTVLRLLRRLEAGQGHTGRRRESAEKLIRSSQPSQSTARQQYELPFVGNLLKYSTRFSAEDDSTAPLVPRPVRDHISPRLGRST